MDVAGAGSFLADLIGRIAGAWSNRPRLGVKIISFRPDPARRRLVFRASVLNYGRATATHCEGFWTIFGPDFNEVESAKAVFWCPLKDDDYDSDNREFTLATIRYNERRLCWAELHITEARVKGTGMRLFPYDCRAGRYTFALVIEYLSLIHI